MRKIERESKRFAGNVGKCWHEPIGTGVDGSICKNCNYSNPEMTSCQHKNPTYTIGLIRSELERVGKWEGFVLWLGNEEFAPKCIRIATTPLLLLQTANAYIEVSS